MHRFGGIFFLLIAGAICLQVHGILRTAFAEEPSGRISVTDKEIIERLTRLEEGQKALNQRMDDLRATMLWGFGILFTMIIALFGYIVWDRRTALLPIVKEVRKLEESDALLLKALKEYAKKEPRLAEILKSLGVL